MNPGEPDRAEPRAPQQVVCYHEAGHAVAYRHYGVELQRVSARPTADGMYQGLTVTVERAPVTGVAELENEMKCSAAGEITEWLLNPGRRMPTDQELIIAFTFALRKERAASNPDLAAFSSSGHERDGEITKMSADAPTGPEGWVRIWREAAHLILEELPSAVEAVAGELRRSGRYLSNADVVALAEAALGGRTR
jgi:hypothetical protein